MKRRDGLILWIVVITLALVAAMTAIFLFANENELCKKSEPCVQQWVSALSGWAGACTTIITLLFIRRQIVDAQRFHRQVLEAEHRPQIEMGRKVVRICRHAKISASVLPHYFKNVTDVGATANAALEAKRSCDILTKIVEYKVLDRYMVTIATEDDDRLSEIRMQADTLQSSCQNLIAMSASPAGTEGVVLDAMSTIISVLPLTVDRLCDILEDVEGEAQKFLETFDAQIPVFTVGEVTRDMLDLMGVDISRYERRGVASQ
ncbi:hypothetical protein GYN07_13015 [Rhizobium leguminosarum bv. viciae 248]|uniref:hypothetical protein n=1 Tax=Rhizobium leguminosarum TaxID=384 RepID=UPI0003A25A4C|nr:hypothetical protein [Rhizobium leguminosarum]MCA2408931.1 hypothetical protein [Rhizobium leguminosarum]NKM62918.1 hypothetical protein [Rhizobium leguminosarum bv. viciae]QHW25202.1 hypothetical protein GYN07_13015 [Rhizobium leguminosarum bv. viciae 248]